MGAEIICRNYIRFIVYLNQVNTVNSLHNVFRSYKGHIMYIQAKHSHYQRIQIIFEIQQTYRAVTRRSD